MFRPQVENAPLKTRLHPERANFLFDGALFFKIMKLFGCFSIVKIDGRVQFRWFCWTTLYTVTFNFFWIGYGAWCLRIVIMNLLQKDFSFEEAVFYCSILGPTCMQGLAILTFVESKKFAEYFEAWADFQELFERLTKKELRIKFYHRGLLKLLILPIFMIIGINNMTGKFENLISKYQLDATAHIFMIWAMIYTSVLIVIYGYLWALISLTTSTVTEALIRDVESLRWTTTRSIRNHIILWFHLRQLSLRLGSALSWTYFYAVLTSFSVALPALYVGSVQVQEGNFSTLMAAVSALTFISVMAEMAHQACDKVSTEFETRVTALIVKMNDAECADELMRFVEKIAAYPVLVCLGGFFPMNRSINPAMYSSFITYLIIIIQFREVEHGRYIFSTSENPLI